MLLARGVKKLSAAPSSTLANRQASERDKGSFSVEEPFLVPGCMIWGIAGAPDDFPDFVLNLFPGRRFAAFIDYPRYGGNRYACLGSDFLQCHAISSLPTDAMM